MVWDVCFPWLDLEIPTAKKYGYPVNPRRHLYEYDGPTVRTQHVLSLKYFPAQLVGGFTLSDLLNKPWSQVSSLPPRTCLHFLSRIGFILTDRRFSEIHELLSHALALLSVRIELAKMILVGTWITYQATGDAGCDSKYLLRICLVYFTPSIFVHNIRRYLVLIVPSCEGNQVLGW